ncbi:hypothetical protein Z945_1771 [Sulfitobacter noctilucae]|uniref:hypothetical protein n=1 Tax=Sulfitobacter noctilucae TaxID=1342302 RepID=UPI000468747A|nr:hypothetical protein [Sulfitobacter noctilucae]KIN60792.1 hypothetical protein Z945_1771 [Sulfitobacter noctilucae]
MSVALLFTAFFAGLTTATVWLVMGGSFLEAFVAYILSGHIAMMIVIAGTALRPFIWKTVSSN